MRGVVWLVLLFVVAVVAATTLGANDGLVSIYWGHWRTDLSLNLFLVALLVLCAAGVAVVHTLARLVSLPRRAGEWRALRRERAAEAALREAQAEHHAGRYGRARKAALRALALQADAPVLAADVQFRVLAHLQAAASMHRLQDRAGRDEQLQLARAQGRRGGLADALVGGLDERSADGVRMLGAEWALDDRDGARALEALAALAPGVARRTQALRLRLQAQRLVRQPLEALRTARLLANHQAFTPVVASGLLRALAAEAMDEAHDADQLRRVWIGFDDADRRGRGGPRRRACGAIGRPRRSAPLVVALLATPCRAEPR
jgi:HemY protein